MYSPRLILTFILLLSSINTGADTDLSKIKIKSADNLEIEENILTLNGRVRVNAYELLDDPQDQSLVLFTDKLITHSSEDGKIELIEALGNAHIISEKYNIEAEKIFFKANPDTGEIDMLEAISSGHLLSIEEDNSKELYAEYIEINLKRQIITAKNNVQTIVTLSQDDNREDAEAIIESEQQIINLKTSILTAIKNTHSEIIGLSDGQEIEINAEKQIIDFTPQNPDSQDLQKTLHATDNAQIIANQTDMRADSIEVYTDRENEIRKALLKGNASVKENQQIAKADEIVYQDNMLYLQDNAELENPEQGQNLKSDFITLNQDSQSMNADYFGRSSGSIILSSPDDTDE